ncbi:MAG: DNA polymerase III subunit delta [Bacteroidetes bacterium]|nr:MAG: DNA polymerase III subunit delta [Bacteroidota bacterium]
MAKGSSSYSDFNALMQQLDQGQVAPVYLLHGEEYHFLEKLLQKIEEVVIEESTRSFNHHTFYAKDISVMDLLNVSRRFPMMAEKQLVIFKEAQYCRTPDQIIPYVESPMESTVLVWYHPGKKMPMNRKPGMAFKKNAVVFTADPVSEKEIVPIVSQYIKDAGYDIEPKPLHLLIENSGAKFSVIVRELEKVFNNVEKGSKIREEHIEKYVGINKEYNIFSLQKALAQKQKARSIEIMNYFSANMNNNPLVLLNASLFSYFKKVAIMQSMVRSTDKEIMSAVGIPFFAINEYRQAASNYGGKKIVRVIEVINDCDLKFKGIKENTGDQKSLFEETVLKILSL